MELIGRRSERSLLDGVLRDMRSGQSRVLVIHGDPGIGKSALMDYLAMQATGSRLIRTAGVESEMELAYAALHQLCRPMLDRLERLPPPQRDARGLPASAGEWVSVPGWRLAAGGWRLAAGGLAGWLAPRARRA
ncbi:ATP-binding protein [Mycobacterium sp. URHB0021]